MELDHEIFSSCYLGFFVIITALNDFHSLARQCRKWLVTVSVTDKG